MFTHVNYRKYKCVYIYMYKYKYQIYTPGASMVFETVHMLQKMACFPIQLKPERCPIRFESSTDVSKMVRLFSEQKTVQQPKRQKAVSKTVSLWRRANRFVFFSEKISFPIFGCISLGFWFFVLITLCFWCVWYQLRSLMIARTSRVIAAENVIES